MGLRDIAVPRQPVVLSNGQDFLVRGVGFNDLQVLFAHHRAMMTDLFDLLSNAQGERQFDLANAGNLAMQLIQEAPALAAELIALAADEPEGFAQVLILPMPVQMEALEKIGQLTFSAEGGAKKFLATVTKWMQGVTSAAQVPSPQKSA